MEGALIRARNLEPRKGWVTCIATKECREAKIISFAELPFYETTIGMGIVDKLSTMLLLLRTIDVRSDVRREESVDFFHKHTVFTIFETFRWQCKKGGVRLITISQNMHYIIMTSSLITEEERAPKGKTRSTPIDVQRMKRRIRKQMPIRRMKGVRKLRSKDIICTQGGLNDSHPGNVRYRKILQSFHEEYAVCERGAEKIRIIVEVIATVRRYGGRFVQYDSESGLWKETSTAMEREKVLHDLRGMNANYSLPKQELSSSDVERKTERRTSGSQFRLQPEIEAEAGDILKVDRNLVCTVAKALLVVELQDL